MLYQILTEEKNIEGVRGVLSHYFEGYTIMHAEGIWKGVPERALVISIAGNVDPSRVQTCAEEIKFLNNQESVLILSIPCDVLYS